MFINHTGILGAILNDVNSNATNTSSSFAGVIFATFCGILFFIFFLIIVFAIIFRSKDLARGIFYPNRLSYQPYSRYPQYQEYPTLFPQPRETVIIKEIVKIPCSYCSSLIPDTSLNCPFCGAPRRRW